MIIHTHKNPSIHTHIHADTLTIINYNLGMQQSLLNPKTMEDTFNYPYCDDIDKYEKIRKIGKGTFGEVYKARHKISKQEVALKKILMDNEQEGFPITALREIKILRSYKKKNVVNLIEVCRSSCESKGRPISYLVFDFCHHDLAGLIQEAHDKIKRPENIKCIMKQLLEGLYGLHANQILHRDMKSSNILITKNGELKIADFGLARPFSAKDKNRKYTNRVVTLWYRPPELLLGERNYDGAIDLWGVGCIMSELYTKEPLMKGTSEQHQLSLIADFIGPICPEVWPTVENLQFYSNLAHVINSDKFKQKRLLPKMKRFTVDELALDLLQRLLTLDPAQRIDADLASDHDYFYEKPYPAEVSQLAKSLSSVSQSQFEYTSRRRTTNPPSTSNNMAPAMVHRGNINHRPIPHQSGPSNNDGQYRDHVY